MTENSHQCLEIWNFYKKSTESHIVTFTESRNMIIEKKLKKKKITSNKKNGKQKKGISSSSRTTNFPLNFSQRSVAYYFFFFIIRIFRHPVSSFVIYFHAKKLWAFFYTYIFHDHENGYGYIIYLYIYIKGERNRESQRDRLVSVKYRSFDVVVILIKKKRWRREIKKTN